MKIMATGPITLCQIDGETMETVTDFIFWAPKSLQMVTAAMKLKLLGNKLTVKGIQKKKLRGRKAVTNLDSIIKSRQITLQTKVYLVKAMVFPVVMNGCESWTMKKVECKELMLLNCGVGEDS